MFVGEMDRTDFSHPLLDGPLRYLLEICRSYRRHGSYAGSPTGEALENASKSAVYSTDARTTVSGAEEAHLSGSGDDADSAGTHWRSPTLKEHRKTHAEGRPSGRVSENASRRQVHTGAQPSIKCDICGKTFAWRASFIVHKSQHGSEKPFSCAVCDKSFFLKKLWLDHCRIHTGERPFACGVCDKRFRTRSGLRRHRRKHSGKKLFPCDVCDKSFFDKWELRAHSRIHTGEKPFACRECDKRFRSRSCLSQHSTRHSGKRFPCDVCQKTFAAYSSRSRHKKVHHTK